MTPTKAAESTPNPSSTSSVRQRLERICCCSVTSDLDADRRPVAVVLEPEELARREPERARHQAGREGLLAGVELLHDGVVVAAGGGDFVLGVGQLVLQLLEVLAGAQLGIGLRYREQL